MHSPADLRISAGFATGMRHVHSTNVHSLTVTADIQREVVHYGDATEDGETCGYINCNRDRTNGIPVEIFFSLTSAGLTHVGSHWCAAPMNLASG